MTRLHSGVLAIDGAKESGRICAHLRQALRDLSRRGLVVATSGGIDSSVTAALAVQAVGAHRVFCLLLPERDSAPETLDRSRALVRHLGVDYEEQDISATLDAIGCYRRRDDAIRGVFPDYGVGWRSKIAIGGGLEGRYNTFRLIVERPRSADDSGPPVSEDRPLHATAFFAIVAATNYKQRVRKTIEYGHADRLHYAVTGTPNRLEHDQGFFVKNGDGSADVKPIAHLYKTQVFALARALGLPPAICDAVPTTDTYSLAQGQDEFYFALPYAQMDHALWAFNHDVSPDVLARFLDITPARAALIYQDITAKRQATRYLHLPPIVAAGTPEVSP